MTSLGGFGPNISSKTLHHKNILQWVKKKQLGLLQMNRFGYGNSKIVLYLVMHDKQPYEINYIANPKNYEKYLPEFEQIVESFRFVGGPLREFENLSGNTSGTNTKTNFSGANLTQLHGNIKDGNSPEELYDECVRVAGKSFCDFLFRK